MWWKEPPDLKHNICAGHYEIFIFQNLGLCLFICFSFSNERVNTGLLNGLRRRYHLFYKMSQMGKNRKIPRPPYKGNKIKLVCLQGRSWKREKAVFGGGDQLLIKINIEEGLPNHIQHRSFGEINTKNIGFKKQEHTTKSPLKTIRGQSRHHLHTCGSTHIPSCYFGRCNGRII